MNSKWTILALSASLSVLGCSTRSSSHKDLELLTGDPWKYEKAGFGSGDNGSFDALDPRIAGGERNNMIVFRTDGTGDADALPFLWTFQNNDSTIYFQDQYYKVRTLSRHKLEIYADQKLGSVNTRYTIVLKH